MKAVDSTTSTRAGCVANPERLRFAPRGDLGAKVLAFRPIPPTPLLRQPLAPRTGCPCEARPLLVRDRIVAALHSAHRTRHVRTEPIIERDGRESGRRALTRAANRVEREAPARLECCTV